ncbi:hypothetical protein OD91_2416 [Lutibacter sp. Hel_I_33_5]|uniref:hypothetical protein n=1 Tax=Lutibacter sp. Hel_I_33_5 TaxID=1566289 RepID=UPI00119F10FC|nr:hypothetical protein [Lutibacter sp. Hel_I_33_5]TVZ57110.1 hypothetical protein OD91_2416 [Lutibacter sp. Hel_I_33_5]
MGENKHIEELDAFAKKYVQEIKIEKPSVNFTANIMDVLLKKENSAIYKPVPLISKKVWFILVGMVVALFVIPFKKSEKGLFELPEVNLSFLEKVQVPNLLENISFSSTTIYAVFFLAIMLFAQILFLKGHFNRRINM